MKRVPLNAIIIGGQSLPASEVLINLVKAPAPGRGFDLAEMRQRIRVIDALQGADKAGYADLEDADHAMLVAALAASSYTLADRHLLGLIDGALNAAAPSIAVADSP